MQKNNNNTIIDIIKNLEVYTMEYSNKPRTLSAIVSDLQSGTISLEHKLQRKEGQWNNEQKTNLLINILKGYPINPTYAITEKISERKKLLYVIDGVQRISTVRDFIGNELKLNKKAAPIELDGEVIELAGKKFENLSEELQDRIKNYELTVCSLSDYNEDDVRQMFKGINSGAKLTKSQESVIYISDELLEKFNTVLENEFWSKTALTPTDIRKNTDRDILIQCLYLISEKEITGFSNKDLYQFLGETSSEEIDSLIEKITDIINKLNELIPEKVKTFKKNSIAVVIYGAYYAEKEGKAIDKYVEALNEKFFSVYNSLDEYLQYCKAGAANRSNVEARRNYFVKMVDEL